MCPINVYGSPHHQMISWPNHFSLYFRLNSPPCPTLKPDVTASVPRTRCRLLAKLYRAGFPCCIS